MVAISLWDTKDYAEAYNTAGYPEERKILDKVLDGTPKVQVSDVISSTIHKPCRRGRLRTLQRRRLDVPSMLARWQNGNPGQGDALRIFQHQPTNDLEEPCPRR